MSDVQLLPRPRLPRCYGAVVLGALTLAGCTNWSSTMQGNPNTEGVTTAAAQEALRSDATFTSALGREYHALASDRSAGGDLTDADYFARKSLAASKGEVVPPEDNRNWLIAGQGALKTRAQEANPTIPNDMTQQRQRLVTALDDGGRNKYPVLAAQAQSRFDCWVEQSEASYSGRWKESNRGGSCYRQYMSAISDLEVLLHPSAYNAYFDWNGKKLNPEAAAAVKQAASTIRQDGTARVQLVGFADRSGSDAYNQKLAQERVQAVRAALIADGIAADRIDVVAKGEHDIPVATKDGVRESKNRVVKIYPEVSPEVASGSSVPR
ncbi:MAG TPA: OmpA family protein [Stellaceae bacterium]|nr:OmpA family protein [Stellaceae bacterium]